MYNEEKKLEYLKYLKDKEGRSDSYISGFKSIFNTISGYEKGLDIDAADFSKEQILNLYRTLGVNALTASNYNGKLRKYATYRNEDNIVYYLVNASALRKALGENAEDKKKLITYSELLDVVENFENPVDQFLLYGLYSGIRGDFYGELSCSTMEDCNPDEKMIWLAKLNVDGSVVTKARKFYADGRLFNYAMASSKSVFYYQKTSQNISKKVLLRDEGERIYKNTSSREKEGNTFDNTKSRITKKLKSLCTYFSDPVYPTDVYWSGFCDQLIKKLTIDGVTIETMEDLKAIDSKSLDSIYNQYGLLDANKRTIITNVSKYLQIDNK